MEQEPPALILENLPPHFERHHVWDFVTQKARVREILMIPQTPAASLSAHVWLNDPRADRVAVSLDDTMVGEFRVSVKLNPNYVIFHDARIARATAAKLAAEKRRQEEDDKKFIKRRTGLAEPTYLGEMEKSGIGQIVGGFGQCSDPDEEDDFKAEVERGFPYDPSDVNPKNRKWSQKRLEVFRERFSAGVESHCERCKQITDRLQLHHKPEHYDSALRAWEYPNYCFEVLCGPCHHALSNKKAPR